MTYKRRYENQTEQNAYENACDCHLYGMGRKAWNDCGIDNSKRKEIWNQAYEDMAKNY